MSSISDNKKKSDLMCVSTPVRVAVLIDGGFMLKRYNKLYNRHKKKTAENIANDIYTIAHSHVGNQNYLYRIFYYDCFPLSKRVHNPISKKCVNFEISPEAQFKKQLLEELRKKRKVALRLGQLKDSNWQFYPNVVKDIISGKKDKNSLQENDIYYEMHQKGIDMKIGVDITTLALKKFVDKIVLISGDSDFVPSAKLARREGIDFVLDAMYAQHIDNALYEHIDGLKSIPLYQRSKNKDSKIKVNQNDNNNSEI